MYESDTSVAPSDAGPVPLENQKDVPAPAPAHAPGKPVPTSIHDVIEPAAQPEDGGADGSKTGGRNVSGHQFLFRFQSWFTFLKTDLFTDFVEQLWFTRNKVISTTPSIWRNEKKCLSRNSQSD